MKIIHAAISNMINIRCITLRLTNVYLSKYFFFVRKFRQRFIEAVYINTVIMIEKEKKLENIYTLKLQVFRKKIMQGYALI